jgi:hypothetical protein
MYICIHIHRDLIFSTYMNSYFLNCIHTYIDICIYVSRSSHLYTYAWIYTYMYFYIYMYIYIYIYIYVYINIYIYIYLGHSSGEKGRLPR